MTTLLIILIVLLLLGNFGYYGRGYWGSARWGANSAPHYLPGVLTTVIIIAILLYLLR